MWKRVVTLLSSAALILFSRWAMKIARPQEDIYIVQRAVWRTSDVVVDAWHSIWRAYGPISDDMVHAWARLRDRFQAGDFGTEGT